MKLDERHSLYRYKGFFFIHESYSNIAYSYTYEKEGIYENGHFRIDLTNPRKFNFSTFPITIRSCHKGDRIATDLPTKDVHKSLQKQSVPFYYHSCYPVMQQNDDIICLPFYKDILSKKVPLTLKFMKEPVIIHWYETQSTSSVILPPSCFLQPEQHQAMLSVLSGKNVSFRWNKKGRRHLFLPHPV